MLFSVHTSLTLRLVKPMVLEQGQRFTIRDGKITLGTGVVTKVLPNMSEEERIQLLEGKKAREKRLTSQAASQTVAKE